MRRHDGRGRDPFVQPKGSTPQKAAGPAVAGDRRPVPAAAAAAHRHDATGDAATPTTQTPRRQEQAQEQPRPTYVVDLRFGQADSMKTLRDVARLTPLPSASSPFFVFLGVKEDGKTLVFLVSSDAKATGDGKCKPSTNDCETIELKAGDTEFFDLTTDDGRPAVPDGHHQDRARPSGVELGQGRAARHAPARRPPRPTGGCCARSLDGRSAHLMGAYRWVAAAACWCTSGVGRRRAARPLDGPTTALPLARHQRD